METMFGSKWGNTNDRDIFRCLISRMVTMGTFLFVLGLVVDQSAVAQNKPQIHVGETIRSILSENQTREYLLYIPKEYDSKVPLPLILLFHGYSATPQGMMDITGVRKVADEKHFIVATPKLSPFLQVGSQNLNFVTFIRDLIRGISSNVAIDKKKIYAAGYSFGAYMSIRLACELSTNIAAIGVVGGLNSPTMNSSTRAVPVIAFHGTADYADKSAEEILSRWAEYNGCKRTPMTRKISEDVTQITYGTCKDNAEVIFFRINEGGHTWPGSPRADIFEERPKLGKVNKDINATNLIWNFFEAHPLP